MPKNIVHIRPETDPSWRPRRRGEAFCAPACGGGATVCSVKRYENVRRAGEFPCHKTTCENDEGDLVTTAKSKHCAGALIFAEKHDRPTQMMRICERIGMYDRTKLVGFKDVFDSIAEMRKKALRR